MPSVGKRKTVPQGTLCPTCGKVHERCAAHRRKVRDENGLPIPCGQYVSFEEIRIAREEGRGAVCRRLHGNKLVGPANPAYIHGNKSRKRFLPSRLLEDAELIAGDPELGSMRHAIVVEELRIEDLMRKLDGLPKSANADEIQEALTDAKEAIEIGDMEEAAQFVEDALRISKNSNEEEKIIWDEIRRTHKILATMVDSERKRQIVVQDFVPRRQLVLLAREIMKTVNKYIPDPRSFSQFTIEMANKIGANRGLDSDSSLNAEFRRLDNEHGEGSLRTISMDSYIDSQGNNDETDDEDEDRSDEDREDKKESVL